MAGFITKCLFLCFVEIEENTRKIANNGSVASQGHMIVNRIEGERMNLFSRRSVSDKDNIEEKQPIPSEKKEDNTQLKAVGVAVLIVAILLLIVVNL